MSMQRRPIWSEYLGPYRKSGGPHRVSNDVVRILFASKSLASNFTSYTPY